MSACAASIAATAPPIPRRDQPWRCAANTEVRNSFRRRLATASSNHAELVVAIAELPSWNRGDSLNATLADVVTPAALHCKLLTAGQITANCEAAEAHLHVGRP